MYYIFTNEVCISVMIYIHHNLYNMIYGYIYGALMGTEWVKTHWPVDGGRGPGGTGPTGTLMQYWLQGSLAISIWKITRP